VSLDERDLRSEPAAVPQRQSAAASELAELTVGLDDETLTVAVLAHVDGLTQDEIAETLDLSRRTIGKRLKHFAEHTRMRAGIPVAELAARKQQGGRA
jgi:DNA-directed RNA polymerase specialized sigma24 family protein